MSEPGAVSTTEEKRTSWSELFFDLVFVFAVTEVSALLEHDHTWAGVLRAFVVFVPIYWVWVGVTVQGDVRDLSAPPLRITVFAIALGGLFMALAVPDAYGESAMLLALSYWGSRALLGIVVLGPNRRHLNPVTVSMVMTGPLLVCGALVHGDLRLAFWSLAAVADLASPTLLRLRLSGMHFDAAHLAERFGLFVLIAIGESVVAIGGTANVQGPITFGVGGAVAVAFVVTCAALVGLLPLRCRRRSPRAGDGSGPDDHHTTRAVVRTPVLHRRDHRRIGRLARGRREPGARAFQWLTRARCSEVRPCTSQRSATPAG